MIPSELKEKNYKRILFINLAMCGPLLLIFAWPYHFFCQQIGIESYFSYPGSLLFAFPFLSTILHGHVTMALGSLHRHHYYDWLRQHPKSYGLFFRTWLTRTRFRLILFIISLCWIPVAFLLSV